MSEQQRIDSDGKDDKNWVRRLLQLLRGKRGGDVIVGTVGEGARGVAVGKGIIQIGTVVIPTLPVLLLVLLLALVLTIQVLRPRGPKQMTGEFNVAVAQFGQVDKDGEVRPSEDGQRLSRWLFERLQDEYESLSPELVVQVWHDSLDLGVKIGIIPGRTPEARAEAAANLAERINADIVIYGNLAVEEDPASFIPEFCVTELPEAEEIIGGHELGVPIPVQLPIDGLRTRLQFNQKLTSRAKALTLFTVGLAWEFAGAPERALEFFRQAEKVEDWTDSEGKEILYLFIGREARLLKRHEEALTALQKALAINPDYARAHIGVGNVYYEQAQQLPAGERLETAELDLAIGEYRQALDVASHSHRAHVELKARLALGGAYRLKGEAYLHRGEYGAADPLFDLAIEETQRALTLAGEGQHRHLGQAYLGLGTAYHEKAHSQLVQGDEERSKALFEEALEAYAQCVDQADAQPYDWFLENLKADYCVPYKEMVQEALLTLQGGNR